LENAVFGSAGVFGAGAGLALGTMARAPARCDLWLGVLSGVVVIGGGPRLWVGLPQHL
jgi:hypothetical protein